LASVLAYMLSYWQYIYIYKSKSLWSYINLEPRNDTQNEQHTVLTQTNKYVN
jgi:hypothetical protein